jgi:hypothetical protein
LNRDPEAVTIELHLRENALETVCLGEVRRSRHHLERAAANQLFGCSQQRLLLDSDRNPVATAEQRSEIATNQKADPVIAPMDAQVKLTAGASEPGTNSAVATKQG